MLCCCGKSEIALVVHGVIWEADADCKSCRLCKDGFNFLRRRHHCRKCGKLVCSECSTERLPQDETQYQLVHEKSGAPRTSDQIPKLVRVCDECSDQRLEGVSRRVHVRDISTYSTDCTDIDEEQDQFPDMDIGNNSMTNFSDALNSSTDMNGRRPWESGWNAGVYTSGTEFMGIMTDQKRRAALQKAFEEGLLGNDAQEVRASTAVEEPKEDSSPRPGNRRSSGVFSDFQSQFMHDQLRLSNRKPTQQVTPRTGSVETFKLIAGDAEGTESENPKVGDGVRSAVFYSCLFDIGPLGLNFIKNDGGDFEVTEVSPDSRANQLVSPGDLIVAIGETVVDMRMKQRYVADLIRQSSRPLSLSFERMNKKKKWT